MDVYGMASTPAITMTCILQAIRRFILTRTGRMPSVKASHIVFLATLPVWFEEDHDADR